MKNLSCLTFLICYGLLCIPTEVLCQEVDMSAYQYFLENISTHTSLEYDVTFKRKRFSSSDTLTLDAHVHQVRQHDSLFGGHVLIELDTMWAGYNGENILVGYPEFSELIYIDPVKRPNAFIRSTELNELMVGRFFEPGDFIHSVLADSSFGVSFVDTLIESVPCLGVRIKIPEFRKDFKNEVLFLTFNKQTGFYHRNVHNVEYQENNQYQEWNFSNMQLGQNQIIPKLQEPVLATYEHVQFDTLRSKIEKLKNVSFIKGRMLVEDIEISLAEDTTELILLDFWFSSCYACIKSIHVMNQLNDTFGKSGLKIYGVNIIDKDPKSERIARFLRNNPMSYPTIMVDPELKDHFPNLIYPALMILDRDRNIIFDHYGYNEHLFEDVSAFVEKILDR